MIRRALERERTLNHTWDGILGIAIDLQRSLFCPSLITVPRIRDIGSHIRLRQARIKAFNPCPSHSSIYVQVAQVTRRSSNGDSFGDAFGRMRALPARIRGCKISSNRCQLRGKTKSQVCTSPGCNKEHEGAICTTSTNVASPSGRGPDYQLYPPYSLLHIRRRAHTFVNSVDRPRGCCVVFCWSHTK
jgi:hypothetical protein